MEMDEVIFDKEPRLKEPYMVAAWPGMGGVAIIAARYLAEKLGAEEFGRIAPEGFFDISGVLIEDSIVKDIEFPDNNFYVAINKGGRDWIIFIGEVQPAVNAYRLANVIMDVAQKFKASRLFTFAAAPTHIYHTKKPRVLTAVTDPDLAPKSKKHEISPLKEGSISGLNGLMLGVAKERNVDSICLLGEIPIYTTNIANPRSSKTVLEVLSEITGLELNLDDIDHWATETDEQIEEKINQLKESFGEEAQGLIEYFDQLAEQTTIEEGQSVYRSEELLKDIERFLKDQGEQRGGH
jgi:proteasome assembly chaperone (PAC2) family protein